MSDEVREIGNWHWNQHEMMDTRNQQENLSHFPKTARLITRDIWQAHIHISVKMKQHQNMEIIDKTFEDTHWLQQCKLNKKHVVQTTDMKSIYAGQILLEIKKFLGSNDKRIYQMW
jgi:hypothetical protein